MAKRLLTLLALATIVAGLNAGPLTKNPAARHSGKAAHHSALKSTSHADVWYGYFNDFDDRQGVGTSAAETYDQAIFIAGDGLAKGNAITSVRFYIGAPSATNVMVWLSKKLPEKIDDVDALFVIPDKTLNIGSEDDYHLGLPNEVSLYTPFYVGEEGVYVGYTYTISDASTTDDKYPIVYADTDINPNANWVRTSSNVPEWTNLADNEFGNIAIKVHIEGEFEDNAAEVGKLGEIVAALGEPATLVANITNLGANDINSITWAVTDKGVEPTSEDADLASFVLEGLGSTGDIALPIFADAQIGSKEKTLTILEVNGEKNAAAITSADFTLTTVSTNVKRNVVVEEFTGTGCGWCPRGLVGMKKLREAYPDNFIGIGVHGYNSTDPMYLNPSSAYPRIFSGSAPSCMINRATGEIDPYYGTGLDILNDFDDQLRITAKVGVEVTGEFNDGNTEVMASATIHPLVDGKGYHIEYVVIADGVESTAASFKQANSYRGMTGLPEDLEWLSSAASKIEWTYDDVALVSSTKNGKLQTKALAPFVADEEQTNSYTLTMPTKAALVNALDFEQIYVVALVVDGNGLIANAAKAQVAAFSGVEAATIDSKNRTEVARYSIDGRHLAAPAQGINIIRYSDGSVAKVMVR